MNIDRLKGIAKRVKDAKLFPQAMKDKWRIIYSELECCMGTEEEVKEIRTKYLNSKKEIDKQVYKEINELFTK